MACDDGRPNRRGAQQVSRSREPKRVDQILYFYSIKR